MKQTLGETDEELHKRRAEKLKRARKLLDFLEIPYFITPITQNEGMSILDLYDILMDEKKLQAIVSKLKMKVFW